MLIKYNIKVSIFFRIFLALVIVVCVYIPFRYPLKGEFLLVFPVMLFCIYGWLYITRFSMKITDVKITITSFLINKTIELSDVVELGMYNQALSIKARGGKIKVTTDLENYKDAIVLIVKNLRERKGDIKIKGEKDQLLEHFSK